MAKPLLYSMEETDIMPMKKQKKKTQIIEDSVPYHVVEDILLKLPPKSLLRFKCLSKSVHDTVSSPIFSREHLQKNETNTPLIVSNDGEILSKLGIDNEAGHINVLFLEEHLKILPQLVDRTSMRLESGCDGILCIFAGRELLLWNPSIRKHKLLTLPTIKQHVEVRFGIGYDPSIDDYKIIAFITDKILKCRKVNVFTLKSSEWRRLSYDLPHSINIWSRPVSVKGAMYWPAYLLRQEDGILEREEAMLCLDLTNETFSTLELPPIGNQEISGLMEHEGKLGCFCRTRDSSRYDVWIMEEDQTWVRLITISNRFSWIPIGIHVVDIGIRLGSPDVDASLKTKMMNLKLLSSCNSMFGPNICCAASLISLD